MGDDGLRVLDLFCGRGGWSRPFVDDGDEVVGLDVHDVGYVEGAKFLQMDIRDFKGDALPSFDLIIGSPPCNDFSTSGQANRTRSDRKPESKPDEYRGMELFGHALRVIGENKPRFWALENVYRSRKFIPIEAAWTFKLAPMAKRLLWTNLPIPLAPDHIAHINLEAKFASMNLRWAEMSAMRAEIPYPIARFIADTVKTYSQRPPEVVPA